MRRILDVYQYLAPALLTPLAYVLWHAHYGDHRLATIAIALPVLYAYIVPGIGTNVLGVWEFDTRLRLGRFRPQHGFVFGSATAMLTWPLLAAGAPHTSWPVVLATGFVTASVLGFWNWIYDIAALRSGVLRVYNQPWAEGRGPADIAADYAPIFFGGFGFVYGAALRLAEMLREAGASDAAFVMLLLATLALAIAATVLPYMTLSRHRHGHNGCRPVARASQPVTEGPAL